MPELVERVAHEKEAYDDGTVHKESAALQARFIHVFQCPNSTRGERFFSETVAEYARGKDILDYGCYDGWMVPRYHEMRPRSITGIDISETAIAAAEAQYGGIAEFHAGDAHAMPFRSESFDLVVGRGILHHLDFDVALREIHRVLRPGGGAVFVEPLGDNPGAKLIRAMTPKARTKDERALSQATIQRTDAFFGGSSHFFYNLASVPVGMLTSLTPLNADNVLLRMTDAVDQMLARSPMRYWMRQVVLVWHKAKS
ncbi:class I SAM-dependent methyltransferase [Acidicapsa dinghuensis]|uniref:Class I SAM-dependent methyltransferase n=1 Tax=Acidicapsa dinghuensis TaxID=2218256 RepID=A0ABW1EMD8_9BACT|nr:class I SAM-dependent methyltransferase [Acidicapsa dinghuensis]